MARFENPLMDILTEGIRARANGVAEEANPYPDAGRNREAWSEGWRLYDTLQQPAPTEGDILESIVWRQRH